MKITLPQVLRAMPLLAANLVPLAGVTFFGWSVFALLMFFVFETWLLIVMDVVRIMFMRADDILERLDHISRALMFLVMGLGLVALQLWAVVVIAGERDFALLANTGSISRDILRLFEWLDLAVPLAVITIFHLAFTVHDIAAFRRGRRKHMRIGLGFARIFAIVPVFILGLLGPASLAFDAQYWALVIAIAVKAALDIFLEEGLAKEPPAGVPPPSPFDPRGQGSWPTSPPPR
jgi:hypothetical protein